MSDTFNVPSEIKDLLQNEKIYRRYQRAFEKITRSKNLKLFENSFANYIQSLSPTNNGLKSISVFGYKYFLIEIIINPF